MKIPKEAKKLRAKLNPNLAQERNERLSQRNEKGSVTLFVLIALIFFIIIGLAIFMTTMNQSSSQQKAVDKIADDYKNVSEGELDKLYDDELNKQSGDMLLIIKDQFGKIYKSGTWINGAQADRLPLTVDVQWPEKIEDLEKEVKLNYSQSSENTDDPTTQLQIFENKVLKDGNEIVKVKIDNADVESDPNDTVNGKAVLNVINNDFEATIKATANFLKPGETEKTSIERSANIKIDRNAPKVTITQDKSYFDPENEDDIKVSFSVEDRLSRINKVEYGWVNSVNAEPASWVEVYNCENDSETRQSLTPNNVAPSELQSYKDHAESLLTYTGVGQKFLKVKVSDIAGNEQIVSKELNVRVIVARVIIGGEVIGEYYKIQDAIDVCPKDNTKAIVELIKCNDYEHKYIEDPNNPNVKELNEDFEIEEAVSTYENQDIVLNLAGHTILNNKADKPTITNNGKLQIVNFISDKTGTEAIEELEQEAYNSRITSLNSDAIINNADSTLIIGDDDEVILSGPSAQSLIITGKDIGIKNLGTFKFFDGNVTAVKAIDNNDTEIEKPIDNSIVTVRVAGKEMAYLGILSNYAARIGGIYYSTLQDAVDDAVKDDTIVLVSPNVLANTVNIISTKDITIDLDGYKISSNIVSGYMINNSGKVKFTSSNLADTAEIISVNVENIYNAEGAEMTIEKTTVTLNKEGTSSKHLNTITNNGTLNVGTGALIQGQKSYNHGVYNTGTLTNSGTIGGYVWSNSYGHNYAVYNLGTFTNRGTVTAHTNNLEDCIIDNYGNLNHKVFIRGGTLNQYDGKVETGGDFAIYVSNGPVSNINITGGNVYGIYIQPGNSATVNLNQNGGTVYKSHHPSYPSSAIYVYSAQNFNYNLINSKCDGSLSISSSVSEANFTMTGENSEIKSVDSYASSGNINIESGSLSNGVKVTKENLALGKNDGTITSGKPLIKGGVEFSGDTFNFYDGKIIESYKDSGTIIGEITNIAPNSELLYGQESNKETLELQTFQGPIAKIIKDNPQPGEAEFETYDTIQDAITAYNGETSGIVLARDCCIAESAVVPTAKEVKIDLNGKKLTNVKDNFITNNGKLVLTDQVGTGNILERSGTLITNNEELDMQSGMYSSQKKEATAIINNKKLKIEGSAVLKVMAPKMKAIDNKDPGTVDMSGGSILGTSKATDSFGIKSNGKVDLNSGTIDGVGTGIQITENTVTAKLVTIKNVTTGIQCLGGIVNIEEGATISCSGTGIDVPEKITNESTINLNGTQNGGTITSGTGINTKSKTTITINKGTINSTSTGIYIDGNKTTCTLNDGTINSTGNYGVQCLGNVEFIMNNGMIDVHRSYNDAYGIHCTTYTNGNIPKATVKAGTVSATSDSSSGKAYGILMYPAHGSYLFDQVLTIGDNSNAVSTLTPVITGKTNGVYNQVGKDFYFYDGKIIGKNGGGSAIEGNITEWPTDYEIIKDLDDNTETAYLSNDTKVARIVGGIEYKTLAEAFANCPANTQTEVELLRNITHGSELEIKSNQDIILDLQGKTISSTAATNGFINNGTFTIKDDVGNGAIEGKSGGVLENNKTCTILGGKLSMEIAGTLITNNDKLYIGQTVVGETQENNVVSPTIETKEYDTICINNASSGTLEILGGTIISLTKASDEYHRTTGIANYGQLLLTRGLIKNFYIGLNNKVDAVATQYGTTYQNVVYAMQTKNATINVEEGALVEANDTAIYVLQGATKGTINLNGTTNGGKLKARRGIQVESYSATTDINIYKGTIEATDTGIVMQEGITCNLYDGEIISTGQYGVRVASACTFNMEAGTISVEHTSNSNDVYGIYSTTYTSGYVPKMNIKGGTITATHNGTGKGYGIYMYPYTGDRFYKQIVTLGDNTNAIDQNSPVITGSTYGIYNQCRQTINFYDGKVIGKTGEDSAIRGNITDWPTGYEVVTSITDNIETAYLSNSTPVAQIGATQYYSLSSAFAACPANTQTKIDLIKNVVIKDNIEIKENQNIILNLNGRILKGTTSTKVFTNNGTFIIQDDLTNGKILVENGSCIENNETFVILSGTMAIETNNTMIFNNKNMTIGKTVEGETLENNKLNPVIETRVYDALCINNAATGTLDFLSGNIISTTASNNDNAVTKGIVNYGELNLIRGNFEKLYQPIYNKDDSILTLSGTRFTNVVYGIIEKNATLNIEDGARIETKGKAIYVVEGATRGTINLNGSTEGIYISGSDGIYSKDTVANILIDNATINATSNGIYMTYGTNCIFNSGEISSGQYGVYVAGNSEFTMNGGSISAKYNGTTYGVYARTYYTNKTPNINIKAGTINATKTTSSSSYYAYGIYLDNSSGDIIVTLGTQDKRANKNYPIITGTTYGVYNYGDKTFNFYDGTIRGESAAFGGRITKLEDKYQLTSEVQQEVVDEVTKNYQASYLALLPTDRVIAFVNGVYYETLQQAITSAGTYAGIHVVLANGCILNDNITINSNQNIVLDLNGYAITRSSTEYSIINDGTLTIIDTSEDHTGSIDTSIITGSGTVN